MVNYNFTVITNNSCFAMGTTKVYWLKYFKSRTTIDTVSCDSYFIFNSLPANIFINVVITIMFYYYYYYYYNYYYGNCYY